MKVVRRKVTVGELVEGYRDDGIGGVVGYGGKLDIRPPYQREFVYKDNQRAEVIRTAMQDLPLNVMYWADRGDGTFEVLDGQQRTISLAEYVKSRFSIEKRYFHNLPADAAKQILSYELIVFVCSGTASEKLDWFRTINIAGERLRDQELRNAVYPGSWLSDAKGWFSRTGGAAVREGSDYVAGVAIQQDILEKALGWIAHRDGVSIEDYMARNQHEPNASPLWAYYQAVIAWVKTSFPGLRKKEMQQVRWGELYNRHKDDVLDPAALETRVADLMQDEFVTKKPGIYPYLLTGDERHLSVRAFDDKQKREAFERQKGVCPACGKTFSIDQMEADHITPWSKGGPTTADNCKMLCADDNRRKSNV